MIVLDSDAASLDIAVSANIIFKEIQEEIQKEIKKLY
jgi:hypothetical protein